MYYYMKDNNIFLILIGLIILCCLFPMQSIEKLDPTLIDEEKEKREREIRQIVQNIENPPKFARCGPSQNNLKCTENHVCSNTGHCIPSIHSLWNTEDFYNRKNTQFDGPINNTGDMAFLSEKNYFSNLKRDCGPMAGGKTCKFYANQDKKNFCTDEGFCRTMLWAKINNYWDMYDPQQLLNQAYSQPAEVNMLNTDAQPNPNDILNKLTVL